MTKNSVLELLKKVKYPGFSRDIVSFGLVKDIQSEQGSIAVTLQITTSNPEHKLKLESDVKQVISESGENAQVSVNFIEQQVQSAPQGQPAVPSNLKDIKKIIAVASGKGGVGKSTVAVNLAASLSIDHTVGLLDLDIYGPSLPMVAGVNETPLITEEKKLVPIEKHGMKLMSFGFVSGNDAPTIWRGPMVSRMTQQFFDDVMWGSLDFLILDLPPGTGDIQLTLVQKIALTGAVIVTTPQDLAVLDVKKGADMFKKVNTPVLGIVENMTHFLCPHCNEKSDIFSSGGGDSESQRLNVPLLGRVPLSPQLVNSSDSGIPFVHEYPQSDITQEFKTIAASLSKELHPA